MAIWRDFAGGRFVALREATGVQLISPIGLSLAALIPLCVSLMIPPAVYSSIVREDDLMFGDMRLVAFYLSCVCAHIAGCVVFLRPVRRIRLLSDGELKSSAWLMLIAPLSLALTIDMFSLCLILIKNPTVIGAILSGHGSDAKNGLDTSGALSGAQPFLAAVVWWASMRYFTVKDAIDSDKRRRIVVLILSCVAVSTLVALVKLARYELMPLYLGLLIVKLRQTGSGRSAWYFLSLGIIAIAIIVSLFALFSLLRGQNVVVNIIGYGPTSFNHLSALLSGRLQYPSSGNYTVGFLGQFPLIGRVFPNAPPPESLLAFQREFTLTTSAGLNGGLIWITSWGYYYVDLGIWVFLFAFLLGAITQISWNSFNRQTVFGLVLYPLFATSIILWITSSFLARSQTTVIVLTAVLLWGWETFVDWRRHTAPNVSSHVRRSNASRTINQKRRHNR